MALTMHTRSVKLIDPSRTVLAVAQVADEGTHYGGTIDLRDAPAGVRALFEEFEEIVNGQMFSFLDEIEGRISDLSLKVVFDDGSETAVKDLQVYPTTGDVSFKVAEAAVMALDRRSA